MSEFQLLKNLAVFSATIALMATLTGAQVFQSFEAENQTITSSSGYSQIAVSGCSNNYFVGFYSATPAVGEWLQFGFNNSTAGTYTMTVYYRSGPTRGICQGSLDGTNLGSSCDQYASSLQNQIPFSMGTVTLTAGSHNLRFLSTGKNTSSSGYYLAIDFFTLTPAGNTAPTITTPAYAINNPATGTSAQLQVMGADDGGESNLVYTWAATGTPPAPVTFSPNGTNSAKNSTATFTKAGSYSVQVTVRDVSNLTVTSTVTVTVNQTVTTVTVNPATATVSYGGSQTFTASLQDQFGDACSGGTTSWSINASTQMSPTTGTSSTYTPNQYASGTYTIQLQHNAGPSAQAQVTIALNQAPVASNVSFAGILRVGQTVTGTYTYSDAESDPEGTTTFKWYRSNDANGSGKTAISGATANTYVLVSADEGKFIQYEVTPKAQTGTSTGASVASTIQGPVQSSTGLVYAYPENCGAGENMIVDGQIKCNSLLIHNWLLSQKGAPQVPDYVFDKEYKLLSLPDIEQYIKVNGHLPEVPAAKELESNGVDMIKLNFILLKKIEEMTLHLICQEKKIREMEEMLNR